jgi:hypothetical protein
LARRKGRYRVHYDYERKKSLIFLAALLAFPLLANTDDAQPPRTAFNRSDGSAAQAQIAGPKLQAQVGSSTARRIKQLDESGPVSNSLIRGKFEIPTRWAGLPVPKRTRRRRRARIAGPLHGIPVQLKGPSSLFDTARDRLRDADLSPL